MRTIAIPLSLLLPALWNIPTSKPELSGYATYYAPGVMEQVVANRGLDLTGFVGGVALNRRGDLGRTVWLHWSDNQITGPYLVVDCAQNNQHYIDREKAGLIVEVDAQTAQRRGFYDVEPVDVTILFHAPWPEPEGAT